MSLVTMGMGGGLEGWSSISFDTTILNGLYTFTDTSTLSVPPATLYQWAIKNYITGSILFTDEGPALTEIEYSFASPGVFQVTLSITDSLPHVASHSKIFVVDRFTPVTNEAIVTFERPVIRTFERPKI